MAVVDARGMAAHSRCTTRATGEVIDHVPAGDAEDVELAVLAGRRALEDSNWSRMTRSERGPGHFAIGEPRDELAAIESLDNGKSVGVARVADVPLAADQFHYMAGFATKICRPFRFPSPCRVSHETIYQTLFIQTRGALKRELLLHLRKAGSVRRPQVAKGQHAGQGQIRDASRFESAHRRPRTVRFPVTGRGTCLRGRRLEGLAGLEGGGDPRIRTPPSAGTWIARMRAASETRNLLLCPTDQATGHSYSTSGCAIVCMPAY